VALSAELMLGDRKDDDSLKNSLVADLVIATGLFLGSAGFAGAALPVTLIAVGYFAVDQIFAYKHQGKSITQNYLD
jgi:hypothetical protein